MSPAQPCQAGNSLLRRYVRCKTLSRHPILMMDLLVTQEAAVKVLPQLHDVRVCAGRNELCIVATTRPDGVSHPCRDLVERYAVLGQQAQHGSVVIRTASFTAHTCQSARAVAVSSSSAAQIVAFLTSHLLGLLPGVRVRPDARPHRWGPMQPTVVSSRVPAPTPDRESGSRR